MATIFLQVLVPATESALLKADENKIVKQQIQNSEVTITLGSVREFKGLADSFGCIDLLVTAAVATATNVLSSVIYDWIKKKWGERSHPVVIVIDGREIELKRPDSREKLLKALDAVQAEAKSNHE